ncbi:hypothetical protein J6590_044360 [Homalodisca vitripennis]|nr:hypothetical protein J6590_044360 [Homalodisca vitripennis]
MTGGLPGVMEGLDGAVCLYADDSNVLFSEWPDELRDHMVITFQPDTENTYATHSNPTSREDNCTSSSLSERRKPIETFSNKNKLVRSGSVSSANPATSSVLRPSTSAYTHSDNAANIATNSSESHSASSSSSGGILSPPPDQPLDKQCIFCLERSESFTEEGLNIHYWKSCPMLMRCQHCQEVVEVASLNQHLADECDLRKLYKKCDLCSDVQHVDSFEEHRNSPSCLQGRVLRCSLCRTVVGAGEDWWREHLNGAHLCPKHPRRKFVKTKLTRSKTPDLPQTSSSMYNFR